MWEHVSRNGIGRSRRSVGNSRGSREPETAGDHAPLRQRELSVGALAELVDLSQSAISQHLGKLRALNLVITRRDRQTIYYSCGTGKSSCCSMSSSRSSCPTTCPPMCRADCRIAARQWITGNSPPAFGSLCAQAREQASTTFAVGAGPVTWSAMMILRVDDPSDPRIAAYLDIRERDLVVRRTASSPKARSCFGTAVEPPLHRRVGAGAGEPAAGARHVLADAPSDLPVYVVPAAVMDPVAGFHVHRGVLACGMRQPGEQSGEALLADLPDRAMVLALVGISNHDNMGALFRNAAAFAAHAVLLDATCCDPLYRKSIRVSAGAALKVPFARFTDWQSMVEALERRGIRLFGAQPARRTGNRGVGTPRPGGAVCRHRGARPARRPAGSAAKACAFRWRQASTASTWQRRRRSPCTGCGGDVRPCWPKSSFCSARTRSARLATPRGGCRGAS